VNVRLPTVAMQNEDMAVISAQQYYVDYGLDLTIDRLSSLLPSYLPDSFIENQKDVNYWIQVELPASTAACVEIVEGDAEKQCNMHNLCRYLCSVVGFIFEDHQSLGNRNTELIFPSILLYFGVVWWSLYISVRCWVLA